MRETDAVAFFDRWMARAPKLNRVGLRALLYSLETGPLLLGFGARMRRLTPERRAEYLRAIEQNRLPQLRQLGKLMQGFGQLAYYGDDQVMLADRLRRRGERRARPRRARAGRPSVSVRPTTGDAYRDWGRRRRRRSSRASRTARGSADNRTVECDVCVIGTGAGGAVVAKELAEGGMNVVMLEEGRHFTTDDFTARPREMSTDPLPRRRAGRDRRQHADHPAAREGRRRDDDDQLGHVLPHAGASARDVGRAVRARRAERRRARSLLPPRRARAERRRRCRRTARAGTRSSSSAERTRSAGAATSSGGTRAAASARVCAASAARRRRSSTSG